MREHGIMHGLGWGGGLGGGRYMPYRKDLGTCVLYRAVCTYRSREKRGVGDGGNRVE